MLLTRIIPTSTRSIPNLLSSSITPSLYYCPSCTYYPIASTSKQLFHSNSKINYPSTATLTNSDLPPLPIVTVAPPSTTPVKRKPRVFTSRKAAIELTPDAVIRIKDLLNSPTPQLIRIGVRNKGCAGMSYHLEYVEKPERFDEIVEQDGVKVVLDSKALFSIIGSEMDWQEDALGAKFVFKNPNIKDACGCGESFNV